MGRKPLNESARRKQHKIWLTDEESAPIKSVASAAGLRPAEWMREAILRALKRPLKSDSAGLKTALETNSEGLKTDSEGLKTTDGASSSLPESTSTARQITSTSQDVTSTPVQAPAPQKLATKPKPAVGTDVLEQSSKNTSDSDELTTPPRTRERARPVHNRGRIESNELTSREVSKETGTPDPDSGSLRSQRSALVPEVESLASPWPEVAESKTALTLRDGTKATAVWLSSNAFRLIPEDTSRLLQLPGGSVLRKAMLRGYATALRLTYVRRWCQAYGRKVNAWHDTPQSSRCFDVAAATLAAEYARRAMTPDQFIDAAYELRPKAVKFPTPNMLSGMLSERIAAWVPPEQRESTKPWETSQDSAGQTWLHLPDEAEPVMVIRTAADRARLLNGLK